LVGEAVVVLDEVQAAARQMLGQQREPLRRQTLWLQGGSGQRAAVQPQPLAQGRDPVARAAESFDQRFGHRDVP
jgi:hypothetical protein